MLKDLIIIEAGLVALLSFFKDKSSVVHKLFYSSAVEDDLVNIAPIVAGGSWKPDWLRSARNKVVTIRHSYPPPSSPSSPEQLLNNNQQIQNYITSI